MKLSLSLVPDPPEHLAHTLYVDMPFDLQVRDREAESLVPNVTELVLTLELNDSIRSDLWNILLTLVPPPRPASHRIALLRPVCAPRT